MLFRLPKVTCFRFFFFFFFSLSSPFPRKNKVGKLEKSLRYIALMIQLHGLVCYWEVWNLVNYWFKFKFGLYFTYVLVFSIRNQFCMYSDNSRNPILIKLIVFHRLSSLLLKGKMFFFKWIGVNVLFQIKILAFKNAEILFSRFKSLLKFFTFPNVAVCRFYLIDYKPNIFWLHFLLASFIDAVESSNFINQCR